MIGAMSWRAALLLGALAAHGCGSVEVPPAEKTVRDPFIAMQSDFIAMFGWHHWDLPDVMNSFGHRRGGESHLYVNRPVPPVDQPLPVGTILIKLVELGDDPRDWDVHAMAKRGGDFNAAGAPGWEYLELGLTEDREPIILWRGEGDARNPGGYGNSPDGTPIGCNQCHGAVVTGDHAFSRALFSPDAS